ncbi:Cyclic nucleotide-binding domain [Trypanosoma melophagium]|uniref:Cyclic nucleotide-binding domain n=1 Tax=Trypanosoma melophagium TaxID=715481 RepID=UPI00351A6834|nr:Cyclic nucleotide-binding domain [Trypanosoma melophagium]
MNETEQEVEEKKNLLQDDVDEREEEMQESTDMFPHFPGISHNLSSTSAAVAPVIPVQNDEMNTSDTSRRVRSHTTVLQRCSLLSETFFSPLSSLSAEPAPRRGSIRTRGVVSEPLDRAVLMVKTYPLMQVGGTAFENQIHRRSTLEGADSTSAARSITSLSIREGEEVGGETPTDLAGAIELVRRTESVVQHAARLKRGCMWEVIISNFLAHQAWQELYRLRRLRAVLEELLLPILLRKRGIKGTLSATSKKTRVHPPLLLREDDGQKAQGSFLIEHSPFFAALHNPKFCEALAEVVNRYRFSAGEAIVSAGSPSQNALYILFSGKCDAILPSNEAVKVVTRSRVQTGGIFGGLFGGKSVFAGTYRAVSQCIVWVIAREDFEILFGQYADENMKNVYLSAFKKYQMERLQQCYPMPQSMSRVPIYRNIDRTIEEYVKDFEPLVLTNGDVLFNQGDPPGVVYCLLEGYVRREQLGPDMTYETGTEQILSPNNADNNFALNTRFLLLGEEPHILPGALRYRCTVVSRAALFYKIEGERFVNALLDDAGLFLQVREKLITQRRLWMKLAPEALTTVPILAGLPFSNLNTIAHAAEPRVVERCVSICEPAQNIREIYILTVGDVRDPRHFNRVPTQPVVLPPPESDDSQEKLVNKGKKEKVLKSRPVPRGKDGKDMNATNTAGQLTSSRPQNVVAATEAVAASPVFNSAPNAWSFFCSLDSDNENNITYPDEHQELSPPLPPNPAKNFLCTIGGGWEGLLLEKWPNGWETTTTVELWALPMLTIRTEFNSTPKLIQSTIIYNARDLQMRELGLTAPIIAKLPRLSVYLPPEKRLTKHSLVAEKGVVLEKSVIRRSRKTLESGFSRDLSTVTGSKYGRATGDLSGSRLSTLSGLSLASPMERKKTSEVKALRLLSPYTTPRSVKALPKYNDPHMTKEVHVQKMTKKASFIDNTNTESVEIRKPKAGPPPLLFLRKSTPKKEEPAVITPELCAIYAGKEPQKGIIRRPPSPPQHKKKQLLPISPSQRQISTKEGTQMNGNVSSDQQPPWPKAAGIKKQWFHVVPDFAPLPGTINNQNFVSNAPGLVPNSAMMVRIEKGRGDVLTSQAAYFASLAKMRRSKENDAASSFSPVAITAAAETKTTGGRGEIAKSVTTPTRTTSPKMMGRPVPGRHVRLL